MWNQQAKLVAPDGAAGDLSGTSSKVVVGAMLDDNGANVNQGSAYVFVR